MADATGWRPLTALPRRVASASSGAAVVARRRGEALTQADFTARVAAWRDALAAQPGARWALFSEDAFDFACALFGAWHAGKTVIVPGDVQDDTVVRLRREADGFLGGLPGALPPPAATSAASAGWRVLDPDATRLVVHTSGTNGEPLSIVKRLAQLDAEVHALETRFGALCDTGLAPVNHAAVPLAPETVAAAAAVAVADDTPAAWPADDVAAGRIRLAQPDVPTIWATVTHQHIYGLLFRVLWPLAAGRPFEAERLVFNEEIARRVAGAAVLVSSPAHLRRLPEMPDTPEAPDWSAARAGLRAVFSSGGPLPPEAAERTLALLGAAPVEVYGSSETGGIAWRQRARHGDTWQPLPDVAFRIEDGELRVRSAHLPDAGWWRTTDLASPAADGMDGFELHGRADRIVKIEEKRVSLTAIERRLGETGDVVEARVLMLPSASGAAAGRPAVVAALTPAGREKLARGGKNAFVAGLRAALLAGLDRVALPRRWRFVDALPINAQGKSPEALLAALFRDAPAPRPTRPAALWRVVEPAHAIAAIELSADLVVFEGHFPAQPILPGVAQVDWAISFARERFAMPPVFLRLEALKFSQPARPGMRMEIEWHWNAAAGTLQFEYRSDVGRHSGGRVVFGDAPAEPADGAASPSREACA